MKLIKIETKGFKSFADTITLDFDGGVVGVVGPNGSGKSNINDAIKWVLGEQSIKSLRGDNSNDVIFAGSKTLSESDKAQVSLTFDNKEQKVSLPHNKITITRLIKRNDGTSYYYINGELARLKDIKSIAMESGIGKSSLAIISQGTISDIAEATPEQRKFIFEEAAGISKYKQRKKEAIRKLDSTTEALEKVRTITKELEKQVIPLKKQADKAKIFLEKKSALKSVEIALLAKDITFFQTKLETLNTELGDVIITKDTLSKKIESISKDLEDKSSFKYKLENEIQKLSSELESISDNLSDLNLKSNKESHHRKLIIEGQVVATNEIKIQAMEEELQEIDQKINHYKNWKEKSNTDIEIKKSEIEEFRSQRMKIEYDLENFRRRLMQTSTKLDILKDYRDNKSHLFKGTKTILENKKLFPGVIDIVAELIDVQPKYKVAIESVLSNALQNVVVQDSSDAVKAIKFLNQNKGGRATFIPLNSLQPKGVFENHYQIIENKPGLIGIASDLVEVKAQFGILKKFLMGNILVAEDIEAANQISKTLNNKYMVVTLNGDVVRVGGILSGGEKQKSKNLLGGEEEIEKLQKIIPLIEKDIEEKVRIISNIGNQIGENNAMIAELSIELARINEKRSILDQQFSSLKITFEGLTNKNFKSSENVDFASSIQDLEAQKSAVMTLIKAKRDSIVSQNHDLSNLTLQKTEFEKTLREITESSAEKTMQKTQAEYIIEQAKVRLSEEYEITIETAQEYSLEIDEEEARTTVEKLRGEIKQLGYVNIESIEAFEEVNSRYEKYVASEEEVFAAQQTIISAINDMDEIIITRLDETVKNVNLEFNNVFQKMFGGGFGQINYTNPKNLLETGIDILAQPPGKTVKNLKLFSGGEKAMIAISLLFAILKSKPLPLCILDEVEAPLDDANVIRFADYLQELKLQTQFIVITHRIGTMSRVNNIFGATMQKRGSTSFFSVKLEEAKKLIEQA